MEIWLRGYCLARDLPESERVPEGFWLEVAKPQQAGRFILRKFDPAAIEALINRITEPAVYIEFPGTAAQASPLLPHGWSLRDDAYLMERSFPLAAMPNATEVDGYIFTERSRAKGLEVDVRRRPAVVVGFVADEQVVNIDALEEPKKRKRKPKLLRPDQEPSDDGAAEPGSGA